MEYINPILQICLFGPLSGCMICCQLNWIHPFTIWKFIYIIFRIYQGKIGNLNVLIRNQWFILLVRIFIRYLFGLLVVDNSITPFLFFTIHISKLTNLLNLFLNNRSLPTLPRTEIIPIQMFFNTISSHFSNNLIIREYMLLLI